MKRRNVVLLIILAIGVFAGLTAYGQAGEVARSVSTFPLHFWLMAFGLAFLNYVVRLARWNYLLRLLGVRVDGKTSALIFFSGLSMTISPGRVGELAKSYFLKDRAGVPVAVSAPVVISERLMDLTSVLLLGVWGLVIVPYGWAIIALVLAGLGVFMAVLASPRGVELLAKLPVFRKWEPFISTSGQSFRAVLSYRGLAAGVGLGAIAWLSEGVAFWLVIRGLDAVVQLPVAISMYCAASLLGAISMLPGGLVSTEGSMLAMLQGAGLSNTMASSSTLIIRVATLWFAVAVGLLALLALHYRAKRPVENAATGPVSVPFEGPAGGSGS